MPVMIQRILQLPDETLAKYDLSSLRITSLSGSALPGELAIEWMDRFGDIGLQPLRLDRGRLGDRGDTRGPARRTGLPVDRRAAPSVRLYDEHGRDRAPGDVGRIFVGNGCHLRATPGAAARR